MLRVAVLIARGGEPFAVVVDDHRPIDDFVATVLVNVGHHEVVVPVAVPGAVAVVARPCPLLLPLVVFIEPHGNHLVAGIDAAGQEQVGPAPVEAGSAHEVFARSVPVVVAPRLGQHAGVLREVVAVAGIGQRHIVVIGHRHRQRGPLRPLQARQGEVRHLVGLSRLAVYIDKIFAAEVCPGVLPAALMAEMRTAAEVITCYANGLLGAVAGVDDHVVGTAHHHLCLAVLVPVVGYEVHLRAVQAHHVGPAVNAPQQRGRPRLPVHLIGVEDDEGARRRGVDVPDGLAGAVGAPRVVAAGIGGVQALHDNLQLAVAVEVGHLRIVRLIVRGHQAVVAVANLRQLNVQETGGAAHVVLIHILHPGGHGVARVALHSAHHRCHLIRRRRQAVRRVVVARLRQVARNDVAVAIQVILRVVVLAGQTAPRHQVRRAAVGAARGHHHQATAQAVRMPLGHRLAAYNS